MSKITRKIKTLFSKFSIFFGLLFSSKTSKKEAFLYLYKMLRYAFGQVLAYGSVGKNISFNVRGEYQLYLTKSPVAMVAFGDTGTLRDEEQIAKEILKEGDICLDVGANIGNFSLCASSLVKDSGIVYAFEAHPTTYEYAKRNCSLNRTTNVVLLQKAVGEESGQISFSDDAYDDVNHVKESGGISVPMIRLDDYEPLKSVASIACIKIDIEGYELFAFKGAISVLSKTKYVLFELYEKSAAMYGHHAEDVYEFLLGLGFEIVDPITKNPFDKKFLKKDTIQNLLAVRK